MEEKNSIVVVIVVTVIIFVILFFGFIAFYSLRGQVAASDQVKVQMADIQGQTLVGVKQYEPLAKTNLQNFTVMGNTPTMGVRSI